jgi:hypothetical protein
MDRSLLTTYCIGWQDGCDAAQADTFTERQAALDAHVYMDLAVIMWGLSQRAGVRALYAYHTGYITAGTCRECAPPVRPPAG